MIELHPLEQKYWKEYRDWVNQDEIAKLIDRYLPVTETEHSDFYKMLLKDKTKIFFSVLEAKGKKKKFIGICALKNIDFRNRKAELYICLNGKGVRGRGLGVETVRKLTAFGFDRLNLNRIYLYTPSYNHSALKCYKAAGFVKEGEFLEDVYCDSRYFNSIHLCLLKKFWDRKGRS